MWPEWYLRLLLLLLLLLVEQVSKQQLMPRDRLPHRGSKEGCAVLGKARARTICE